MAKYNPGTLIPWEGNLYALPILQNSIVAKATKIEFTILKEKQKDLLTFIFKDNGCGMDEELLKRVENPYATSRTTRKVGLGIPMFKAGAEAAGGMFSIASKLGEGTCIQAGYKLSHWDCPPLGDMAQTIYTSVICNENINFLYLHRVDAREFRFDTREIRRTLGEDVPFNLPEVMAWIKEYLAEGIHTLYGGA